MRVQIDTPRLTDGVSQQPDSRRFRSQAASIKNAWLSIVDGLDKRNGSHHVGRLYTTLPTFNYWVHWLDRKESRSEPNAITGTISQVEDPDRYVFMGNSPHLGGLGLCRCWDTTLGSEVHIEDSASAAAGGTLGVGAGTTAATFDYLATSDIIGGQARETLRLYDIADHTFVVNRQRIPAMSSTISSTPDANGVAYIFIRATAYHAKYDVELTTSVTGTQTAASKCWGGIYTTPVSGPVTPPVPPQTELQLKTDDIVADLTFRLNALTGVTATSAGNVIKIIGSGGETLDDIELHDSQGDTLATLMWEELPTPLNLPTTMEDGFKLRITGDADLGLDDYFIEFVADTPADFGPGHWEQTVDHGSKYIIDPDTMPHRLVRRVGTGAALPSGYTPGANEVYFEFANIDWGDRVTGDETLVPDPSFIGYPIETVFLIRNRLGFLADDNLLLSEVNSFFNFWRTDLTNLLDSDPIDVAIGHTDIAYPRNAVAFENDLLMFSNRHEFRVPGEIPLTPKTTSVRQVGSFLNDVECEPVVSGTGILFIEKNSTYSQLRELFRRGDSDFFDAALLSEQVPRYLPGTIREITTSTDAGATVLVLNDPDTEHEGRMFVNQYHWNGNRRIQSAWHEWTTDGKILSAHFYDDVLYYLVDRDTGVFLEYIETAIGQEDQGNDYGVRMDRKALILGVNGIYDAFNNETAFYFPYDLQAGETPQMMAFSDAANPNWDDMVGNILSTDTAVSGSHNITVKGNWTSETYVWLGVQYEMEYEFGSILVKQDTEEGERAISSGPNMVFEGNFVYDNTFYFEVEVDISDGASVYTYPVQPTIAVGNIEGYQTTQRSGEFPVPVMTDAREATITIRNTYPWPARVQKVEWEVSLRPKHRRM